jgi:hypothetical protein
MNATKHENGQIDCEAAHDIRSRTQAIEGAVGRSQSFAARVGGVDAPLGEDLGDAHHFGEFESEYAGTQAESLWRLCRTGSR